MMKRTAPILLLLLFVAPASFPKPAQTAHDDDRIRGAFIATRPSPRSGGHHARTARPPRQGAMAGATGSGAASAAAALSAIGFGYTIYQANAAGQPVRVDPRKQFHEDERVRFLIEPSIDGYLYIFHSANGGQAEMTFPDPRLAGGMNAIKAHAPMEIPSSREADSRARWFRFDNRPAVERLYFVVSREPLAAIPTGSDLLAYYHFYPDAGLWTPPPAVLDAITAGAKVPAFESVLADVRGRQPQVEIDALTRGFGLPQTAPQPAVVRVNASSDERLHVTVVDLIHQ